MKRLLPLLLVGLVACSSAKKQQTKETAPTQEPRQTQGEQADDAPPLIDRDILFGNPDRASVRISPDGEHLAWLAPKNDVLNVWVAPVGDLGAARAVTDDEKRGIRRYAWAYDNEHIVYLQDTGGDENWHVYSVDLESGDAIDLTPQENVAARIQQASHKHPGEIVVALNDRDPQFHELYKIDLDTGKSERVQPNKKFMGFFVDDDFRVHYAMESLPTGAIAYHELKEGEPQKAFEVPHEDTMTTSPVAATADGSSIYWFDSRGHDTSVLKAVDPKTGATKMLFESPKADVKDVLLEPKTNKVQAVAAEYERKKWHFFDERIEELFDALREVDEGDIEVTSRTLDDSKWVVAFLRDIGPVRYYLFDTESKNAEFLFTNRKQLEGRQLAAMKPVLIEARDGLTLVSYLTLPVTVEAERPDEPLPMVLDVHGGPWSRDRWGYNPIHQWLANRGYAVLSVNFRGSTGFGKEFLNAGDKEWGRKMHDDLIDAVNWAVDEGIADEDRVAIMGGSYGGYATLVGLTMTPDVFAAGVDIVGPSNLITLLQTIPPYWKPVFNMFTSRVGDPGTEEGLALLKERSPVNFVDNISKPLLIGQGANDPRVKQSESDQIVQAMKEKELPVTYVLFPDEGHGFARPENRLAFYAVAEAFLARHLGGRFEPLEEFDASTMHIPVGAGDIPGVEEELCAEEGRCQMPEMPKPKPTP